MHRFLRGRQFEGGKVLTMSSLAYKMGAPSSPVISARSAGVRQSKAMIVLLTDDYGSVKMDTYVR